MLLNCCILFFRECQLDAPQVAERDASMSNVRAFALLKKPDLRFGLARRAA